MANSFYDVLETRSADGREAALLAALPEQIHLAQRRTPAYGRILAGIDPMSITNQEALAALPVTRKSDLTELQSQEPPFGGFSAVPPGALAVSSGVQRHIDGWTQRKRPGTPMAEAARAALDQHPPEGPELAPDSGAGAQSE